MEQEIKNIAQAYPDGNIPIKEINKIRKEANGEFRDDHVDLARIRGNATRELVYNTTEDQAVKHLLNEQRKLINAEQYLDKLKIHKVKGGRLGNYVFSGLGALVGGSTKLPLGAGELMGAFGGRTLSEFLQRRQLRSIPADIKTAIESVTGKDLSIDIPSEYEKIKGKLYEKSPNINPTTTTATNIDNITPTIAQKTENTRNFSTDFTNIKNKKVQNAINKLLKQ
jgi:hypothetical protein